MAHRLHGKLPWADIFQPAIAIARQGFHVTPKLASMINKCAGKIQQSPAMRETYMKGGEGPQDGMVAKPKRFKSRRQEKMYRRHLEKAQRNKTWVPKGVGDLVLRPNLANTLERVAREGSDAFYKGDIAEAMVAKVQAAGGRLSLADLAGYEPIQRTPLVSEFRGFKVTSVGAPAAGAILIQILKVLERLPLRNSTSSLEKHLFLEALKFGYAGRIKLGDPAFNAEMGQAEQDILAQATIDTIESSIDHEHTHEPEYYTQIYGDIKDQGTTHLSVLDIDGMAVSVTDTVNLEFGAFLMDAKTGVLLNNEMGDFSLEHTQNSYGLPPSLANLVQAGKRPMSSSTPVVLERNGQVVLVTGAAGGSRIISVTAQVEERRIHAHNPYLHGCRWWRTCCCTDWIRWRR
jgi:gamma-glutamyltranspeptidase